jgi:hypothetical protein
MVYVPGAQLEWPQAMLRAAAALRVFHIAYRDPQTANQLCQFLCAREDPVPVEPPTNHPGGWLTYRNIFRDLQRHCGLAPDAPPLQLPPESSSRDPDEIQAFADAIPYLSEGQPFTG